MSFWPKRKTAADFLGVFEWPELTLDELFQSEYRNIIVIDGLENPGQRGYNSAHGGCRRV